MSQNLKFHLALDTPDVDRAVTFYSAFFGRDPVKLKPGYAKFDLDQPPLNFTLNRGTADPAASRVNHLGIQVGSTEEVKAAAARLAATGLATREENDTDCCYALQDKVWVQDPDGHRWEVFVVKQADTSVASAQAQASVAAEGQPHAVGVTASPASTALVAEGEDCCASECCA